MNKNNQKKIISEVVEKLKEIYKPRKIILFGSYAHGKATEDSDIDLLVVKNTGKRRVDRFVDVKRIIYKRGFEIPISPLVYTPKELKERLRMGDNFINEILKNGVVLYDRDS